jgi:biofilm PGA synthesis N-glycosyltransferase PgaC
MKGKFLGLLIVFGLLSICLLFGKLLDFVFFYPLFMSVIWITGGIYYFFHWERHDPGPHVTPLLKEYPFVTILIPCFNESTNAIETIEAASRQNYPHYEIIAINDGSSDDTAEVLNKLAKTNPLLRVLHFARNQGKAMALRMGSLVARGEFLVCIDGDAMLDPNAAIYLVQPLVRHPRVGAVTGNPRIRSRSSLLGKVQVGEFSSIIGLIKRAQRIYGCLFTVSGVVAAFRRRALHSCGYWDVNMMTEDIDISWALQLAHWQIQYQPSAVVWILMPETIRGLWKQRRRWARGGAEVYFKNFIKMWNWPDRRMWMLVADFCLSTCWALSFALCVILWFIGKFIPLPPDLYVATMWPPAFWGLMLATVSLFQFLSAMVIETRYDYQLPRMLLWTIWYPMFFWLISLVTTLAGLYEATFTRGKKRAVWVSPDRGFR